jgi:hypothetical protein
MSKEYQEPEEKDMDTQNAELIDDFNPLDEPVIEKDYTRPNVKINPKDFAGEIPEPSFTPPPMTGTSLSDEEKIKKPKEPLNKDMNELSNKDKNEASERMADMCIMGYEALNNFVDKRLLFDERKLNKMAMEGELDMNLQVPISANDSMPLQEFVREYNEQSEGTIKVSKEFKEEIKPPLVRVFAKRGVGLTDEQYIGYIVIKDMIGKGFMVAQSLAVKKQFLTMFQEQSVAMRGGASQSFSTPPPPPSQPAPQPTPPPTPQYEYTPQHNPDTNVNDFVNQMTGGYAPPQMSEPINEEPMLDNSNFDEKEEKPKVTIIDDGSKGKRGRPKKK